MADKIIVTNRTALMSKYPTRFLDIERAIDALIKADHDTRGLATVVVYIDDKPTMINLKGTAVTNPDNLKQNLSAINTVYEECKPDYLMILGAWDVIPHQLLANPLSDDADRDFIHSDLPYACKLPVKSVTTANYYPTRAVGRLPDAPKGSDPTLLIELLRVAANYPVLPPADYQHYFGLCASDFEIPTRFNLEDLYSNSTHLYVSEPLVPPAMPQVQTFADSRMHFINCHGLPRSSKFYGVEQNGDRFTTALTTADVTAQRIAGTVAAVECCYGAWLYAYDEPSKEPICLAYLRQGAYAFVGSTCFSYGFTFDDSSIQVKSYAADVICALFVKSILAGASAGCALLEARQKFVAQANGDRAELKTLAQFCLMGDPSIQPVVQSGSSKGLESTDSQRSIRQEYCVDFENESNIPQRFKFSDKKAKRTVKVSRSIKTRLARIAQSVGLDMRTTFTTYVLDTVATSLAERRAMSMPEFSRQHVATGPIRFDKTRRRNQIVTLVVYELAGRVVSHRLYHQR